MSDVPLIHPRLRLAAQAGALIAICARSVLLVAVLVVSPWEEVLAQVDFAHDVFPVLKSHCGKCHGGEEREGGFSLNSRETLLMGADSGAAISIGNASASILYDVISTSDPSKRMPPEGEPLSDGQIKKIAEWIDQGAVWDDGLTLAKSNYEPPLFPRRPELPPALQAGEHPIDRLLQLDDNQDTKSILYLEDHAQFARRVSLDLQGLLPTEERLSAFLKDAQPDKRTRLVESLLSDKREYAEHWLTFWNDLLRNDYGGTGFITGGRKQISQWLYQSLIDNKPYDQMARELIAPSPESAGFSAGIQWRGTVSAGQTVEIQFAQSVGQSFLGINLKCASCHDSFIDRWKLDDAYGLASIYSKTPLDIHRCDKPTGKVAKSAWLFPELGTVDPDVAQPERLNQLASLMTHPQNGRFSRTIVNRLWHRLMGRGIVEPVDAMQTRPWNEDLLDWLAADFAEHGYDLKHTIQLICCSRAYQSQAEVVQDSLKDAEYRYRGPRSKRMTAEQFVDCVWQLCDAAPIDFDAPVSRGGLSPEPAKSSELSSQPEPEPALPSPAWMVRASLRKSDALQRTLGRPNRDQIVTSRPVAWSTLEALELCNAPVLNNYLARGAEKFVQTGLTSSEIVQQVFVRALSRSPSDVEKAISLEMLGDGKPSADRIQDFLWTIVMLPEFQIVR